jgi:hypothetical protein
MQLCGLRHFNELWNHVYRRHVNGTAVGVEIANQWPKTGADGHWLGRYDTTGN